VILFDRENKDIAKRGIFIVAGLFVKRIAQKLNDFGKYNIIASPKLVDGILGRKVSWEDMKKTIMLNYGSF
jgi:hypothetical protein